MYDAFDPMSRVARMEVSKRRRGLSFGAVLIGLVVLTAVAGAWRAGLFGDAAPGGRTAAGDRLFERGPDGAGVASPSPRPDPYPSPEPINRGIRGLTTFRGNATRTYYGEGPVPSDPRVLWRFPSSGGMCSQSTDLGVTTTWCGTGWTGQPNVVKPKDGPLQVRFGAYDRAVHILRAKSGRPLYEPYVTGDIIKGTVTTDPDGYPLLYSGSRDNQFRVLALDRGRTPVELWSLGADSAPRRLWNDDWDSSALIVDDYLMVGGENSWFYVVKLNRDYDESGTATVDPEIRMLVPGFDDQLLADVGDNQVSIEGSPAFDERRGVVYFSNSGGLVQGWDVSDILAGGEEHERVFRFWTGEDTDASVVIDEEGFLYVASELERMNARGTEVGQLMKLDPTEPDDPVVWSIKMPETGPKGKGGLWATPGLYRNAVIAATNTGRILGINRKTGRIKWELNLPPPTWTSPVIVDGALLVGDCAGVLHAYDLPRNPLRKPPAERWSVQLEGCIESTPAVWKGMVFVGSRGGAMYGIGDA
jgi:outer membrane protein assembly factor BamB